MEHGNRSGDGPDRRINSPDHIARQERLKNNPNKNGPMSAKEFDAWTKMPMPKRPNVTEGSDEIPSVGDIIRTKKMQMEGKVERTQRAAAGYMEVLFRLEDGRLMKTPMDNVTVVEKLADEDQEAMEGTMGGINRSAPANDVSYEKVLDEVKAKWLEEQKLDELSIDTMKNFKKKASSPDRIKQSSGFQKVKDKEGVDRANAKIKTKTGDRTVQGPYQYQGPARGTNEGCGDTSVEERIDPWSGYTPDDKKANALSKAPKSTMQGSTDFTMSDKVKDTIDKHGVKYAFDYYVKKHGLPPRQFQVFAGLTANKPNAVPQPPPAADPKKAPEKLSWWKRMLNSLGE